jgi:hypothetical protein
MSKAVLYYTVVIAYYVGMNVQPPRAFDLCKLLSSASKLSTFCMSDMAVWDRLQHNGSFYRRHHYFALVFVSHSQ